MVDSSKPVAISPECIVDYRKMGEENLYSYLIFKLNYDKNRIESTQKMLAGGSFGEFKAALTADKFDCLYALYQHPTTIKIPSEEDESVEIDQNSEKIVLFIFKPLCALARNKIRYDEALVTLKEKLPRLIRK